MHKNFRTHGNARSSHGAIRGHIGFGRSRSTDDRATNESTSEEPGATRGVRTATRPADDTEIIETEVISEVPDVTRETFIGSGRIERAVAVARTVKCDQPDAFADGNVCDGSEVAMRSRRAVERNDGRAIARAELAPREVATVRKLEHSKITHRARLPDPARCCERRSADLRYSTMS